MSYLFLLPLILVLGIAVIGFSRKGRNKVIAFMFGEVIEDLGTLQEQKIRLGTQTTRLLRCRNNDQDFLVLETTDKTPGSIRTTWTKIDDEMLQTINSRAAGNN